MKKMLFIACLLAYCGLAHTQSSAVRLNSDASVINTIIWNNQRVLPISLGVPVRNTATDSAVPGIGNIRLQSTPFSTADYRINSSSPAYNTGTHDYLRASDEIIVDTLDLSFLSRFEHERCPRIDMGAFEYQVVPTSITMRSSAGPVTECEDQPMTLSITAIGTHLTYQWYKDGIPLLGKTSTALTLSGSMSDAGTYKVIVLGDCCGDTTEFVVNVVPNPQTQLQLAIMKDTTIVSGQNVLLTPAELSAGQLTWYHSDLKTPVGDDLLITNIEETRQYVAVLENPACESYGVASVMIFVEGTIECEVKAWRNDTLICLGESIHLLPDAENTKTDYQWRNLRTGEILPRFAKVTPDTTTRYVMEGITVVPNAGTPALGEGVLCGATDGSTPLATDTLTVNVYIVPLLLTNITNIADISPDANGNAILDVCEGAGGNTSVSLTSLPPADVWLNADREEIGNGNITVLAKNNEVTTFIAVRNQGGCTIEKTLTINNLPLNFKPAFTNTTICAGDSVMLDAGIDPRHVSWINTTTGDPVTDLMVKPTETTVYRATQSVCGADAFVDITVNVQPRPQVPNDFEAFDIVVCEGIPATLASSPNALYWTTLDGTRIFNPIENPTDGERYIGWYIDGACLVSDTANVWVETIPDFTHSDNAIVARGTPVLLWSDPPATDWVILSEGFHLGSGDHIVQPMGDVTTYRVEYIMTACEPIIDFVTITTIDTFYITVIPENLNPNHPNFDPNSDFYPNKTFFGCFGEASAGIFIEGATAPYTVVWKNDTLEVESNSITGLYPGDYRVEVTDKNGMKVTADFTVPDNEIRVSLTFIPSNNNDCNNGRITAQVVKGLYSPYELRWGSDVIGFEEIRGNGPVMTLTNLLAGVYRVYAEDARGCRSEIQDTVLPCAFRPRPNRFITPNDDGHNDYIRIRDIEHFPNNHVTFFNSYGEIVWKISDYDNNNPDRRFSGRRNNGQRLPDGVYYFILEAEGIKPVTGWILMRLTHSR